MGQNLPKIAIIVVSLNEEKYISQCINSLINQNYKGEVEIIIADGGSTDKTIDIIQEFKGKHQNIILLNNENKYQAFGRNLAIERTDANLIAYLDAHSYADENWLENLYESFVKLKEQDEKLAAVGSIHLDAANTEFTKATTAAFNSLLGGNIFTSFSTKNEIQKVNTAYACLYDRNILEITGYYYTRFIKGEDLELNSRITQKFGFSIYINPQAITYYYKKETLGEFLKQMSNYGYWRYRVMRHLKLFNPAIFLPSIFIIFLVLLLLLSFLLPKALMVLIFTVSFYLTFLLSESIFHSLKFKCRISYLFLNYLIIHFGYGFGMLKAMLSIKS
jgi:glycosyltransferase involved in cell wall biosynthesis